MAGGDKHNNGHLVPITISNGANGDDSSDEQSFYAELKDNVFNRDRSNWQINVLYDIQNGFPDEIDRQARELNSPVAIDVIRGQLDYLKKEIAQLDYDEPDTSEDQDLICMQEIDRVTNRLKDLKDTMTDLKYHKIAICDRLAQMDILDPSSTSTSSSSLTGHSALSSPGRGKSWQDIARGTVTIEDPIGASIADLNRLRQQMDRITEGVQNLPLSGDEY